MAKRSSSPGVRRIGDGQWELVVDVGRDPITGKRRRVTRRFQGNQREATKARAQLLVEVGQGRHDGTNASVDHLCREWLKELERRNRKPTTIHGYRFRYEHDIRPTLGSVLVRKVTTKMLTDLYGAHQRRGLRPATIYQIHATISSMMSQACRWGWRDSNPAQWAEVPSIDQTVPIVPTPDEVRLLIEAAEQSRRPEYARCFIITAATGMRRGEVCGLRFDDLKSETGVITVRTGITQLNGRSIIEGSTKNRRLRPVAIGPKTLALIDAQRDMMSKRAAECEAELGTAAFVFSDAPDGLVPWKPDAVTKYFARLRDRTGLRSEVKFKHLRKFMETYGQDLGFSLAQVALRAGHDPAVASRYYTGRVAESDRALAAAIETLL